MKNSAVVLGVLFGYFLISLTKTTPPTVHTSISTSIKVPLSPASTLLVKPQVIVAAAPVVPVPVVPQPAPTPPAPVPEPPVQPPAPVVPTTHEGLMAAAGISASDYPYVEYIVSHESSWNQDATEPTTQAHGLVQALPFSKTGCEWEDAVCTLAWGQVYATSRYGSWYNAYLHWEANGNW